MEGKTILQVIAERRSIRKFKRDSVPREILEHILRAASLAPSSKNRQPWKFVAAGGAEKEAALDAMARGLSREAHRPLLPESAAHLSGAAYTLTVMRQAPVLIFVVDTLGEALSHTLAAEARVAELCNVQSIGAAIEHMLLAAAHFGLGSLWICDTFFAQEELSVWLNAPGLLVAAVAIGYADEAPSARPRKPLEEIVSWRM